MSGGVNKMYQFDPQNVTAPEKEVKNLNFLARRLKKFYNLLSFLKRFVIFFIFFLLVNAILQQ